MWIKDQTIDWRTKKSVSDIDIGPKQPGPGRHSASDKKIGTDEQHSMLSGSKH